MPTRYIKESARTSKNLNTVSDFTERLFWRLITTADDFGRFLACPVIVKSTCFPLSETLKASKIEQSLHELEQSALIGLYHVGDRQYGWFVNWEKHQGKPRAIASKYPDPSHDISPLHAVVGICMQPPTDSLGDPKTDTDLNSLSSSASPLQTSSTDFDQFWACYPRKVGKKQAWTAWQRAKDRPALAILLTAVQLAKTSAQWLKEQGQFIPHPATWLTQGRWDDETTTKPVTTIEAFLLRGGVRP